MKFIVDEMPTLRSDCPFYKRGVCDNDICKGGTNKRYNETYYDCEYFDNGRNPEFCNWLTVIENES